MLLGEALADRASKKKQLEQVEARAVSVARYQEGVAWARQLRSELQQVAAVRVADLRAEADQIAESRRTLDVRIQQAGWSTELLD
jgi:hypothetical protein